MVNLYPLREAVFNLENHARVRSQNAVNLRSCELFHPQLTHILAENSQFSPECIQFYPYPDETKVRISELWGIPPEMITFSAGSDPNDSNCR